MKIKQITPGTHGHNMYAKVHDINVVLTRDLPDNTKLMIAEALVGDETGCVLLTARNGMHHMEQLLLYYSVLVDLLLPLWVVGPNWALLKRNGADRSHACACCALCALDQIATCEKGSTIIIRNAKVDMYQGHMRLSVDKWGLIEPSPQPLTGDFNTDLNLSNTEYELVSVNPQ